jgi:hypothetical protein
LLFSRANPLQAKPAGELVEAPHHLLDRSAFVGGLSVIAQARNSSFASQSFIAATMRTISCTLSSI